MTWITCWSAAPCRSDDSDPLRIGRDRLLVLAVEQALSLQTALKLFIGHLQRADARGLDIGGVDLVGAVPLIEGHKAPHQNHHAIFRLKLKPHGIAPEHDAPYSGGIVLQREVDMTGAVMPHHIGELPLHIYFPQPGILLRGGGGQTG